MFWSELNYERINRPFSRRGWSATAQQALSDDPILLAGGGQDISFHIVYCRLALPFLSRGLERPIVNQLLREHPYSLFVFSNQDRSAWHFLNVKYSEKLEKRRVFRRITIAPNERLRTAAERIALLDIETIEKNLFGLSPLSIQARHDEAFDVEPVTREFFKQYHEIFEKVEVSIAGIEDQERRRLFTQRLFNRLMFVAFVQKKGWLEFERRVDYLDALWEDYLKGRTPNSSFYRDRLKLLFFSGLNTKNDVDIIGINRGGFLIDLIGNIPYLNGGLFEEDEDDANSGVSVPDESCRDILEELFARFNFTVTESTPLDIDVAVDPEMLGKVFEELVTGRHETGSYYTPKPIVSFMCKQGLKGYLAANLAGEKIDAIATFVDEHEPGELIDPESVLDALRGVRACDLACGSGAYLLGMLHELIFLRDSLFTSKKIDAVSMHARKLEIIQNNLYGVDIDPFAVNIARLRLWLSLAVEFEGDHPPPLPNLDFKIEMGNSVSGPSPEGKRQMGLMESVVKKINVLKSRFMMSHGGEKRSLRLQIEDGKKDLARWAHKDGMKPGFDWPVEFAEVFAERGFDIILANPPYVRQELIKDMKPVLAAAYPDIYSGTADLYCYFYARAAEILRPGGMLVFISSNKWFRAKYGENLRKYLAENCYVQSITDFGELPVFEAATFPMIFVAQKCWPSGTAEASQSARESELKTVLTQVKSLEPPYPDVLEIIRLSGQILPKDSIRGAAWVLTDAKSADRLRKMEKAGIPLGEYVKGRIYRGILTGFNEAFVIDGAKREELVAADPKSAEIIKETVKGDDIRKWRLENQDRWLIFTRHGVNINDYPAVKKHLSFWKHELEPRPRNWQVGKDWQGRKPGPYKWYEIQDNVAYYEIFDRPKIIYPEIAKEPRFTLDRTRVHPLKTSFSIPIEDLYLLGVLNSSLAWEYLKSVCSVLGDADKSGRLTLQEIFVSRLPIPKPSDSDRDVIESLVKNCLKAQGQNCEEWECEIDERVAALYGL